MSNRKITLSVDRARSGAVQVSINEVDADGYGHGYRLGGPKYAGDSTNLAEFTLDVNDAREIQGYLKTLLVHGACTDTETTTDG